MNSTLPQTGFASLNPQKDAALIMMSFTVNDTISLSTFSVTNLIKGVGNFVPGQMIRSEIAILMSKLFTSAVETSEDSCKIDVSRDDVVLLRQWLETRMAHCEQEKNAYNEAIAIWNDKPSYSRGEEPVNKFNPDTYIGMKLLLIELREWLLGEEVIEERSSKSTKAAWAQEASETESHN